MRFATIILSILIFTLYFSGKKNDDITNRQDENIPAYLDSIASYMEDFAKENDTIYNIADIETYGYTPYVVGKFIDGKDIYAIYYIENDTLTNFYHFNNNKWKLVGSKRLSFEEPDFIDFQDMDNDGRNEIIIKSHFNMNGNTWQEVFYCSKNDGRINYAGNFTAEYRIDKEKKIVETDYGGSWWMPLSRSIYRWYGGKLILEKEITLRLKEVTFECNEQILSYYGNSLIKAHNPTDSLSLIYEVPFEEVKHQQLWDNFFTDNQ